MAGRRVVVIGLGAAGAGAAYYLYKAGGDPKVAQKTAERDITKASETIKSELPGKAKEVKKDAEAYGHQAGQKFDSAVAEAKAKGQEAKGQLSSYEKQAQEKLEAARQETGAKLSKAVDKFDKSVEEGASKAKSGISSWFGGGSK